MSEVSAKGINDLVSKMERDWQDLRTLLQGQHESRPASEVRDEISESPDSSAAQEPTPQTAPSMANISSGEAEAIVQGVWKVHRDSELLERVVKVEKQNRRITIIGSMVLTVLTLAMSGFAYTLIRTNLWDRTHILRLTQELAPTKPMPTSEKPAAPQVSKPAALPAVVPPAPPAPDAPAAPSNLTVSAVPTSPPATPVEAEVSFKYVGSKTSNRYHYPDCKWAKQIAPGNLLKFNSVAAAKGEGYTRCPACQPPLAD